MPVSYTHLDVYKRQIPLTFRWKSGDTGDGSLEPCRKGGFLIITCNKGKFVDSIRYQIFGICFLVFQIFDPLDVYKRQ